MSDKAWDERTFDAISSAAFAPLTIAQGRSLPIRVVAMIVYPLWFSALMPAILPFLILTMLLSTLRELGKPRR